MAKSKVTRAIALYQKGHSFAEIGRRLGISASTARRWIKTKPSTRVSIEDEPDYACGGPYGREAVDLQAAPKRIGFFERVKRAVNRLFEWTLEEDGRKTN